MTTFERYIEKLQSKGKMCRVIATLATGKQIAEVNLGEYYFVWDYSDNKRKDFKTFDEARAYCKEKDNWV